MEKIDKVLIVDNQEANLLFLEVLLRDMGFSNVFKAKTADEGLVIVESEVIQFIVAAWELNAGMSGTLFIQKAKAKRKRKYLPFVIYSKKMTEEDIRLTKELGFQDILGMPFDKEKAKKMFQEVVDREMNLDPLETKLRKIENLLFDDKPEEAIKLFSSSLFKIGPTLSRVYTLVAENYFRLGKYDKCEENIANALKTEKDYYPAMQLKAQLLSKQEKHDEAIKIFEELAMSTPKNLTTKVGLGQAYVCADKLDDAQKVFDGVIQVDNTNQNAKDGLASVAVVKGDLNLASKLIAETDNGNDMARFLNSVAIGKVTKGELEEGIKIYNNAISLLADKAKIARLYYNVGLAYRKKGDTEKSFQELTKSYVAEPSFEKAYSSIARAVGEMKEQGITPDKTLVKSVKSAREQYKAEQPQMVGGDGTATATQPLKKEKAAKAEKPAKTDKAEDDENSWQSIASDDLEEEILDSGAEDEEGGSKAS
ncbi:MAG: response regulator [Oligoflexales bacterium]|nr:response regulator [Oligoflexales bacterium]